MQSPAAETNTTTRFVTRNHVKQLENFILSHTVKLSILKNLEDSHKDSFLKMAEKFTAQMNSLSTPLRSL